MEVITLKQQEAFGSNRPLVVGIGQFDGLHKAHLSIIGRVKEIAAQKAIDSAIITFDPHPDFVLGKRIDDTYLTPFEKKVRILSDIGIDRLLIIPFTLTVAQMMPEEFVRAYLDPIPIDTIVAGFDYRYGYRGLGNVQTLIEQVKNGVDVQIIDQILFQEAKMGATLIRELLGKGDVETVKDILGRYYSITGTVMQGSKIGRTLGFKTANIELSERYQELKSGVYGVLVDVSGRRRLGICNIGYNPTINTVARLRLEVHIIDFEEDIYGLEITVDFVYRIRDELWFPKIDDLIERIRIDREHAILTMRGLLDSKR